MPFPTDAIRSSARTLRKQPVFATVVVLSLALAIALTTTMYSVFDAMAHPRLDVRKPEQLYWVRLYGDYKFKVSTQARDAALATGMHSYSAITRVGVAGAMSTLLEHGQNVVEGGVEDVAANYFDVLGPRLLAGRTFIASDAESAASPLVLKEDVAATLFPNGESPIGATVIVDRVPHVVVGVVSTASDLPESNASAWTVAPYAAGRSAFTRLIRLRDGATRQDAERELGLITARVAAESGESLRDVAFIFHSAADPDFQVRPIHYALVFAVCAVLLVACANLANLQLARGIGRQRDLALRAALGATRGRIVRYLLTESALLAAAGLALGLLFTYFAARILAASIPPSMGTFAVHPHMSWRVLSFALAATVFCLVLVGVAPAIHVSRADPNQLLKSGAGTGATKRNRRRYGMLVGVEFALALALSCGAAVSVRLAMFTRQTAYGYDPAPLVVGFAMNAQSTKGTVVHYADVLQSIANRVRGVPGVYDATAYATRAVVNNGMMIEDAGGVHEFDSPMYSITLVSPSYFRTFRLPIVRGRDFLEGERDVGAVVVDEQTARVLWPNANPIGAQLKFGDPQSKLPYVRVVGVVGEQPAFPSDPSHGVFMRNVRSLGRIYYLPGPADTLSTSYTFPVAFVARAEKHPEAMPNTLRRAFPIGGELAVRQAVSMSEFLGLTRKQQSADFVSLLFSIFGALGVGLAAFGVYGVVAHSVAERRRELGVRIALGATARDILHAVLRESIVVALAGVAGGLLLIKYSRVYLASIAAEPDVYNAGLFAAVAVVLLITAAAAAFIPAMRATRVDPTESLRND